MVNGEETNLRITHDYVNGIVAIDGVWDGIDENGMASRNIYELQQGDAIVPLYYAAAVKKLDAAKLLKQDVYIFGATGFGKTGYIQKAWRQKQDRSSNDGKRDEAYLILTHSSDKCHSDNYKRHIVPPPS
ncbi:MAG: hypothetical protein MSJ26_00125 [Oscillospiraceae bacterium]|nr:hypothetical protein [Oscillospiraceae bacterium]